MHPGSLKGLILTFMQSLRASGAFEEATESGRLPLVAVSSATALFGELSEASIPSTKLGLTTIRQQRLTFRALYLYGLLYY